MFLSFSKGWSTCLAGEDVSERIHGSIIHSRMATKLRTKQGILILLLLLVLLAWLGLGCIHPHARIPAVNLFHRCIA